MIYTIGLKFAFAKKSQVEAIEEAIVPFLKDVININEGEVNQEISFIETRESHHDEPSRNIPDKILSYKDMK